MVRFCDGLDCIWCIRFKVWEQCWESLSQEQIQAWIERILWHIEQISQ